MNAGKADLGWAGTRVFDELGDPAFNPLHAPMLIDSYELEEKVLGDGLVDPMLESLGDLELQGIGVLPGPLRRPLGKHPLRGPGDWDGARISSSGGEQIDAALRSLGAEPRYDSPHVREATDELDGIETHIAAVPGNHYHYDFPYLTGNVVLWPRPLVLFAGPDVSADDLAVLRKAAKEAIPEAVAMSRSLEREPLAEICRRDAKVVDASAAADRRAARRVPPDLRRARARPRGERGGRADPASWRATAGAALHRCAARPHPSRPRAPRSRPAPTAPFITRADAKEHGFAWSLSRRGGPGSEGADERRRKEYRLEFTEQGTFLVFDVWLDGTANIGWEGTYSIYRDRITVQGNEGTKITARVEVDGDRLRFTDVQPGPKTPEALTWGSKPFVKID